MFHGVNTEGRTLGCILTGAPSGREVALKRKERKKEGIRGCRDPSDTVSARGGRCRPRGVPSFGSTSHDASWHRSILAYHLLSFCGRWTWTAVCLITAARSPGVCVATHSWCGETSMVRFSTEQLKSGRFQPTVISMSSKRSRINLRWKRANLMWFWPCIVVNMWK